MARVKSDGIITIAHFWCGGHFTNINACGVCKVRVGVQVSRKKLRTHIHLDYVGVKILSCIKKERWDYFTTFWNFFHSGFTWSNTKQYFMIFGREILISLIFFIFFYHVIYWYKYFHNNTYISYLIYISELHIFLKLSFFKCYTFSLIN